jgi:PKD repeat protein
LQTDQYEVTQPYQNTTGQDLVYQVKLITRTQFGCIDSTTKQIVIHAKPQAAFTLSPNPANTLELVTFNNLTNQDQDWYYRWQLELETGTDSIISFEPPATAFDTYYDIPVTLLVRNEYQCADTVQDTLDIIPPPPLLDFSPDTMQGCPPLTVIFTDLSQFTDTTTYLWDFGDGGYSTAVNPVHTFYDGGMYMVTLTAMGLDQSTMSKDTMINVYPKPSAAFSFYPEEVFVPDDPVKCVPSYPSAGETYYWDFGVTDPDVDDTSNLQEPAYYYQDTGIYNITFIVLSEENCPDTLVKQIRARGTGKIKAPNVFFPSKRGGGGGGAGDGGMIDDGSMENDIFAPLSEGVLDYHLEIYTRWGEKLFSSEVKNYGWTGYYHGKLCREDVYVWKVSGTFSDGQSFVETGTITLIHNE